jgi:TPR repeat protein
VALASFYENSRGGLPKDDREAARLYSLAAAQGNPFAQMALASFYENGRGGLPTDKIYAANLRKAASDALAVAMVPGSER